MSADDPLDGADVGETRRVEVSDDMTFWGLTAVGPYVGNDREASNVEIESAEIVGESGNERIHIEFGADVTKQLPLLWDHEPHEQTDSRTDGRGFSKADAFRLIASGGIAVAVATLVFQRVLAEVPEGPIEFTGPTLGPVYEILALILLVVLIVAAIPYLPRLARGGRCP